METLKGKLSRRDALKVFGATAVTVFTTACSRQPSLVEVPCGNLEAARKELSDKGVKDVTVYSKCGEGLPQPGPEALQNGTLPKTVTPTPTAIIEKNNQGVTTEQPKEKDNTVDVAFALLAIGTLATLAKNWLEDRDKPHD